MYSLILCILIEFCGYWSRLPFHQKDIFGGKILLVIASNYILFLKLCYKQPCRLGSFLLLFGEGGHGRSYKFKVVVEVSAAQMTSERKFHLGKFKNQSIFLKEINSRYYNNFQKLTNFCQKSTY